MAIKFNIKDRFYFCIRWRWWFDGANSKTTVMVSIFDPLNCFKVETETESTREPSTNSKLDCCFKHLLSERTQMSVFDINLQITGTSSISQGSVTHLSLQLLCSESAQQRLTVWVEDGVSAQLSGLAGSWATESFIEPVEEGDDEERQAKLQLNKQTEQHQPQQHFEQSEVCDGKLSWSKPSSHRAVQEPVTMVLQRKQKKFQWLQYVSTSPVYCLLIVCPCDLVFLVGCRKLRYLLKYCLIV